MAGAVDSVGLAFGWTVFNLLAVYLHGLAVTALLNVAMFCGIALSAPVAARLTRRLDGRRVLQVTAAIEAVLRVGSLAALFWGVPIPALFLLVLVLNVAAWIGFAGMRTEIAATGADAVGMTRYLALTVALEAVGASLAALLPISANGVSSGWLAVAFAGYGLSLLPTVVVASKSTVRVRPPADLVPVDIRRRRILMGGAALMVVCSGPTLLFVGLSAQLHGHAAVVGASIAFAVGSLLSPGATRLVCGRDEFSLRSWPIWCAGMVAGWAVAPWSVEGLWFAQLLSGVCLTGFQGVMDHALAGDVADGNATTNLAQGSAARAIGSAAAVRLVPFFATPVPLAAFAGVASALGVVGGAVLARAASAERAPSLVTPSHSAPARTSRRVHEAIDL